jgi:L-amino acid N-acyltransferase YncA
VKAPEIQLRDSLASDCETIQKIYSHHVLHGTASFEIIPPTLEEMIARRQAVVEKALPYIVAEREGLVVGYAYVTMYRARPAYRFTVENSVYVQEGLAGEGIGSKLLVELIKRCELAGFRQMIAVIGDSSPASVALHKRHGFEQVGLFRSVGYKAGAWRDTAMLQLALGAGAHLPPEANGAHAEVESLKRQCV